MVKKSVVYNVIKYLALLTLAVVLLYFSFKGVKWSDFISGLRSCNYSWIIVSMLVGIFGFFLRALRWRLLLLPLNKEITVREAFDGINISYLTNFALPRAGEFARCGVIAKTKKVTFEACLGTVVVERSLDLLCLMLWTFVILLFKWDLFGSFIEQQLLNPLFGQFSSLFWPLIILIISILIIFVLAWLFREKLLIIKLFEKIAKLIDGLKNGLLSVFKMKNKWLFIFYTLLIWGTYWLTSYATILAFPNVGDLNYIDALFLMIVGGLGWVVPVQGGIGAYHFIVSLALAKVYGIDQSSGVVFATISHESQALVMIICGVISLISISLWKKQIK